MWKSVVMCALVCTACGGSTEPRNSSAGAYGMVSFYGRALPANDGFVGVITNGALTLGANGFYAEIWRDSETIAGAPQIDVSTVSAGQWTVSGTILTLADTNTFHPFSSVVKIDADAITFPTGTIYKRQ